MEQQASGADEARVGGTASPSDDMGQLTGPERRAMDRALNRAASIDMRARKRQEYAQQDAAEREQLDRMRAQRNAADDERAAGRWQMAVDREMASAERRSDWVEAHYETQDTRREVDESQRQARRQWREREDDLRARMRQERNAEQDEWRNERWQMDVDREMASAERRSDWVEAHYEAVRLRQEARAARHEALPGLRAAEGQQRALMREQRNAEQDERSRELWEMRVENSMEQAEAREGWARARGVAIDRKRAMREAVRGLRHDRAALREGRAAQRDEERRRRNARADELSGQIDRLAKERAVAGALARDARRTGDREQEEAQRALEVRLKEREARLRSEARKELNAASDDARRRAWEQDVEWEMRLADARADYLEARGAAIEQRRAMAEPLRRAAGDGARREGALVRRLREQRNASDDARAEQGWRLDVERETTLAALREDYLNAEAVAHAKLREAEGIDRPARKADLAEERAVADRHRELRNEAQDARAEQGRRIDTQRELDLMELRGPLVEARAEERRQWEAYRAAEGPQREAALDREREAAERDRKERNELLDEHIKVAQDLAREREYARAMDREQAREVARQTETSMKAHASQAYSADEGRSAS